MRKYLLSTGRSTDKIEEYVVDLFRLYLQIWPGDIPGDSSIGFDFILTDVKGIDLKREVATRVDKLISKIREKFNGGVTITVEEISFLSTSQVKVTLKVNNTLTENVIIGL